jgi:DNA-binding SARP family transcriptional activator/tetratricopeptide (TPR) repeat protein
VRAGRYGVAVQFRLLGPLEVVRDGHLVPIRAGKHRALLAGLLLRPGRSVPVGDLVDIVWGERPPARPRNTIHIYVARMRAVVGDVIETTSDGYQIEADGTDVDIKRFDDLLNEARRCAERDDRDAEADVLREALALWRGEPLADVPSDVLHRQVVPHLREQRMRAQERRVDVDLRRGRHAQLVGELMALTAQHPLRERLWAQLMTALQHSGRRAEALEAYRRVRRILADELGIDPGTELQEAHARILADRSYVDALRSEPGHPVPRQLPPAPRQFTGRTAELAHLDGQLRQSGRGPAAPVVISAIAGTAGVGKSALAAQWGRRVADDFPDGQLWVNLRAYDPGRTVPAEQALAVLLRGLGVPDTEIPLDLDSRIGLYRSLLEGRRMLIVLDNAGSSDQVRPLLPGAPGCFIVVTSRDDLTGLIVRDGATRVRLDLLTQRESGSLLRQLLGPAIADNHPGAVDELVRLCARLPLALRIAADRVAGGAVPMPEAVRELAEGSRLDAFAAGGDPSTALRAVFSWSYDALAPAAARLFGLLGLIPGEDWDAPAAAALAGCPLAEGRRLLGSLASAHLVEQHGSRYGMHDLLHAYAIELAALDAERESAWRRLCDHYLETSTAAAERAFPSELSLPRSPAGSVAFDTVDDAVGWLDTNRVNVVAAGQRAADTGPPDVAWQLADVLRSYLLLNRHIADARATCEAGLSAALRAGDAHAEARMSYGLGTVLRFASDYSGSRHHHDAALDLFRRLGDRDGQIAATVGLGSACADLGELAQARELLGDAVVRARRQGLNDLTGIALATLFSLHHSEGELRAAVTCITEARDLFRARGNTRRLIPMLINRAVSTRLIGRYDEAMADVTEGLALTREVGLRHYEASASVVQALVALDLSRPQLALELATEGLEFIRTAGLNEYEDAACNALGWIYWVLGEDDRAIAHQSRGLECGRQTGFVLSQLQGHIGLAAAHHRLGDVDAALDHVQQALTGARERRFRLSECQASLLLAVITADQGDQAASRQHLARADQIRRDTGYLPSWYMPAPGPA